MKIRILFGTSKRVRQTVVVILALLLALTFMGVGKALGLFTGPLVATGLTAPRGELWLGEHLWVSDSFQGFCRLDTILGWTTAQINRATCFRPGFGAAGAAAFDAANDWLYVPDASPFSQGVYRLNYDPSTETVSNPTLLAPGQLAHDDGPLAVALGPDGKLYLGLRKGGRLVRLTNPSGSTQAVEAVGATSSGLQPLSLAFAGGDLYLAEPVRLTILPAAKNCSGSCLATPAALNLFGSRAVAYDGAGNLYAADFASVTQYNLKTKTQTIYANAGAINDSGVPFEDIRSLGFNGQGNLLVGEDPSRESFGGRIWAIAPGTPNPAFPPPGDAPRPLASLKTVPVPEPPNLMDFVQDRTSAIQLGKVLFWDMQVGSDGVQACASCHFQAGADVRSKNSLDPGVRGGDSTFQVAGPNYTLSPGDFPLTKHADPDLAGSPITADANDVVSSQGVFLHDFVGMVHKLPYDNCVHVADSVFNVGGINVRRVEPRNTPSVVNAVFNYRNFWDGRANNIFNGVNPFGPRDTGATVWKTINNSTTQVTVAIPYSSLASQAVGPPGSFFEMSCDSRSFAEIGHKLLGSAIVPLGQQWVDAKDSVLGTLSGMRLSKPVRGLVVPYPNLVKKAFRSEYWQASKVGDGTYTQMEANFSLFFGLSIQMYEATLVSNNTPFDQFMQGNRSALTPHQQLGMALYLGQARCVACHGGPELTKAAVGNVSQQHLERMVMGDGSCAVYDNGFYNIGVRPTAEDIGVGGGDPFGNPLSESGMALQGKFSDPALFPAFGQISWCDNQINVDGAFKTPGLRNVELNGPYFHNGGQATLRQVVDFYDRGGDFTGPNLDNAAPNIQPLGLSEFQKVALVDFLVSLTDERVRRERAPFDHPQLCLPNGEVGDITRVTETSPGSGEAVDTMLCLPAVGAGGNSAPLQPFLKLSPFDR